MNRFVQWIVRLFLRYIPDSFVVAAVLTLLTFLLATTVAGYSLGNTVLSWGDGFWNLLKFTNQDHSDSAVWLRVGQHATGAALAVFARWSFIRGPKMAYVAACLITGLAAMVSWGLSLIVAGISSRAIGEVCRTRGIKIHYPLLVASAFSGFVVWHQGLSSSIALTLATPDHFLQDQTGLIATSRDDLQRLEPLSGWFGDPDPAVCHVSPGPQERGARGNARASALKPSRKGHGNCGGFRRAHSSRAPRTFAHPDGADGHRGSGLHLHALHRAWPWPHARHLQLLLSHRRHLAGREPWCVTSASSWKGARWRRRFSFSIRFIRESPW